MDIFERSEARKAAFEAAMQANAAELLQMLGDPLAGQKPDLKPGTNLNDLPSPGKYYHRPADLTPEPVRIQHRDPTTDPPQTDLLGLHDEFDAAVREAVKAEAARRIIAVDFDGTLCEARWPEIGPAKWAVISALIEAQAAGARLILWTSRCGERLEEAVRWSAEHGLHFEAVNANLPEVIAEYGADPRKITADVYLDDRALSTATLIDRYEERAAKRAALWNPGGATTTEKEDAQ